MGSRAAAGLLGLAEACLAAAQAQPAASAAAPAAVSAPAPWPASFGPGPEVAPVWRPVGVPGQKAPFTRYRVESVDGAAVLRLEAQASYGNLVHGLPADAGAWAGSGRLSWRWRLGEAVAGADLRVKAGDDAPLKVCALFDLPMARVPFWERQVLRLARHRSGEALPAATLCYVWDARLPALTVLHNAYSPRVRYLVLRSSDAALHAWQREDRDLGADFILAFGEESRDVPPLLALAVGADADNTGGHSLAWVADVRLTRSPP